MSHITDVKLKVRDLDSLEEAVELLGGELIRDKKTHNWFGRFLGDSAEGRRAAAERGAETFGKCDHAIRIKGASADAYEIGVVKAKDGDGFDLIYDSWGSGQELVRKFGGNLDRIRHEYAVAQARKKAQATLARKGWTVAPREDLGNGRTRLRLRKR